MIFVTGDTHGHGLNEYCRYGSPDGFTHRLNDAIFPEQTEMTKDDYVIILGDFGGVWETNRRKFKESKDEEAALDWLDKRPFTTLFVPGNHENWDRLTGCKNEKLLRSWFYENMSESEKNKLRGGYPRKEWHGGFVREIRPSVLMLEPGVFDIDGATCFAYGGAQSHDISGGILKPWEFESYDDLISYYNSCEALVRIHGYTWWPQEQPGDHEELLALQSLYEHDYKVDFVLTHSPAASDQAALRYSGRTRIDRFLETIKQHIEYRHWFSGHLHINADLPGHKEHVLYKQIIRIR